MKQEPPDAYKYIVITALDFFLTLAKTCKKDTVFDNLRTITLFDP